MDSKKQAGVWIDGKRAVIVTLENKSHQVNLIPSFIEDKLHYNKEGNKGSFMGEQHISHEKTFDERKRHQLHSFLQEVILSLQDVHDIYICGPAEVKTHLRKELQGDEKLENSFRAMDTCEQMTENQLVAKVKKFFEQN